MLSLKENGEKMSGGNKMEDHILHVQMLGGFSMEYNGKRLASEKNFT